VNIDVVIPALNEQQAIAEVVRAIPRPPVRSIVVADNGSDDDTAARAREAGAQVVFEPERGYGAACAAAIAALPPDNDLLVFVDGDGSDDLSLLVDLVAPILDDQADLVVGTRTLGLAAPDALTPPQRFGNAIASAWLRRRFGLAATDLGPFRAIRRTAFDSLAMRDRNYGWTVELQIKAARAGLRYAELPMGYRPRIGLSKVSGTVRGVVGAGFKIIGLLAYYDLVARWRR